MLSERRSFIAYALLFLLLSQPAQAAKKHTMAYSVQIAAATIAMEASGEGQDGQLAVAFVLINRLKTGRWGSTLASVALARKQFSCWNEDDPNRLRMAGMKNADPAILAAEKALDLASSGGSDPTHGATHYYSITMSEPPEWASQATFLVQIGNHRFYNNVR